MEQNGQKGRKVFISIIVLLILIILGMIGYFLYDKGMILNQETKKEVQKEKESSSKEEEISINDAKFATIYQVLSPFTYENNRENGYQSFTGAELAFISVVDLIEDNFTKTQENDSWGIPYYTLPANILDQHLKTYFDDKVSFERSSFVGSSFQLKNVNFNGSGMSIVSYDSTSDTFKVRFSGVGGTSGPMPNITKRKIIKATQKGDTITLVEKAIYYTSDSGFNEIEKKNYFHYSIYKEPAKLTLLQTLQFDDDSIQNATISVDDYLDKTSTITQTYKFNKESNHWYFASSKIQ